MADKCTLHENKLEAFKSWLDANGIPRRPGKGEYQVLQVLTENHGYQVVFLTDAMKSGATVHYSINDKLAPLVRRFISESKKRRAEGSGQ